MNIEHKKLINKTINPERITYIHEIVVKKTETEKNINNNNNTINNKIKTKQIKL